MTPFTTRTALVAMLPLAVVTSSIADPPRLVLQITVDGLRADLLTRGLDDFGDGGFRRLLDRGTVFTNAHYAHANTETIVGHATLATGAHPAVHGLPGNVWFDAESKQMAYNIEDAEHPIVGDDKAPSGAVQLDPTQRLARTRGRSPRALQAETLADKLLAFTGGNARAFGISGKDRGAVALAGRGGTAYWFSTDDGSFITSTWYTDEYPEWVTEFNAGRRAQAMAGRSWSLQGDLETYRLHHRDDRPYETDLGGFGRVFPHRYGDADSPFLMTQVFASPAGDALLAEFAIALIDGESIGRGPETDYLSVSFSSLDAVQHFFGPASVESEDTVRRLDGILAKLLEAIDQRVGLDRTLILLSADHGMAEAPEYMAERGMDTGRLTPEVVLGATSSLARERFGIKDVIRFYHRPFLYLDEERILASGHDLDVVRESLADALTEQPGVHLAITAAGVRDRPRTRLLEQIANSFHPTRSGDIYIVQEPYWFNYEAGPISVMHGSPWRYDTHVPLIFCGPGIPATTVHREVQPADASPTLAALLGMTPPASAQGTVLPEVFGERAEAPER